MMTMETTPATHAIILFFIFIYPLLYHGE